jgi:hypothetical protein
MSLNLRRTWVFAQDLGLLSNLVQLLHKFLQHSWIFVKSGVSAGLVRFVLPVRNHKSCMRTQVARRIPSDVERPVAVEICVEFDAVLTKVPSHAQLNKSCANSQVLREVLYVRYFEFRFKFTKIIP